MSGLNAIAIAGVGSVSPAGWGADALWSVARDQPSIPVAELSRPGRTVPLRVRQVPAPAQRPATAGHARLRRSSPISQYAVAAATEAIGSDREKLRSGNWRLGVVLCVMSGCVNYSRRLYDEVLRDPATASPLVFPETVFNAPASHLAALVGTTAINYTVVGDTGTFLQGLALGANWLMEDRIDGVVIVGAEEMDWLTADAFRLFSRRIIISDGAGALYLRRSTNGPGEIHLRAVTDSHLFVRESTRSAAARRMRSQLSASSDSAILFDSRQGIERLDAAEDEAWRDWEGQHISVKPILGEGLMAASAWQCVLAVKALQQKLCQQALISVVGCNQQAIGADFSRDGS